MIIKTTPFFVLLLTACAAPAPPVVQRVEVPVPVIVPCAIDEPPEPTWAADALPLGSGVGRQMQALRADRLTAKAVMLELRGVIRACR